MVVKFVNVRGSAAYEEGIMMPRTWCPGGQPASARSTAYALINALYQLAQLADCRDRAYIASRMTAAAEAVGQSAAEDLSPAEGCEQPAPNPAREEPPALRTLGSSVRLEADRLIEHLVRVVRRVDPGARGYVTWRFEQTTNDICYSASSAGRLQQQRLDDLARARTATTPRAGSADLHPREGLMV